MLARFVVFIVALLASAATSHVTTLIVMLGVAGTPEQRTIKYKNRIVDEYDAFPDGGAAKPCIRRTSRSVATNATGLRRSVEQVELDKRGSARNTGRRPGWPRPIASKPVRSRFRTDPRRTGAGRFLVARVHVVGVESREHYNNRRRHQSLGQATPRTAWDLLARTPAT